MPTERIDAKIIEKKVTELSNTLAKLGKGKSLKDLIKVLKFPGWTTPAEFILTSAIIESMQAHAIALDQLQGQLLKGGKAVIGK